VDDVQVRMPVHLVLVAVSVFVVSLVPSALVFVSTLVAISTPFFVGCLSTQIFSPVAETVPQTCPSCSVLFDDVQL